MSGLLAFPTLALSDRKNWRYGGIQVGPSECCAQVDAGKPKPTRLKVITGNPGKRPLNLDEPTPEPAVPDCPPELSPAAQTEWQRLAGEFGKLRVLTNLGRGALATYCSAYALWAEAVMAIQKFGVMVKSPTRGKSRSPQNSDLRIRLARRTPCGPNLGLPARF